MFTGGLFKRGVLVEERVFVAASAVHGDDEGSGGGVIWRNVEAVGLLGVIDGGGVLEAEVLAGGGEGQEQEREAGHGV